MKKFVKMLPLVAIVFVSAGVFAFNVKEEAPEAAPLSVVWFQLSASGDVMDEIDDPDEICDEGTSVYCAVSVNISDLDSNGLPQFDNVEDAGASNHYEDITKRNN